MNIYARRAALVVLDGVLLTGSLLLALSLRFEFSVPPGLVQLTWRILPWYVIGSLILFVTLGLYRGLWRYASLTELVKISLATALSVAWLTLLITLVDRPGFPRSVILITGMLVFFSTAGLRVSSRLLRDFIRRRGTPMVRTRSLIIGAGDAGVMILRDMLKHGQRPIGFVDDDQMKWGQVIQGVSVLGGRDALVDLIRRHDVNDIIIAMPSAPRKTIKEIYDIASTVPQVSIRVVPALHDIATGKVEVGALRPINLEDLLGREPVKLNLQEVAGYLQGLKVMVTGAGGSIGSELCRQIAAFQPGELIMLDHDENAVFETIHELKLRFPRIEILPLVADIRDRKKMVCIFQENKPDVVFHAAAHKHVPFMEDAPEEAVKTNIFGTLSVAEAALQFDCERFVLISTDKAVNPTSVMGATKRVAELVIQLLNGRGRTRFMAVRFGNVLGSRGSVVPLFQKQIAAGGPVTVTDPQMTRYFMTIPEASQLVLQAAAIGVGGEVFVLDMGEPVKIVELARTLIRLHGLEPERDIEIKFTGRRPGEKLYEEVLTAEEGTEATKHERIFSARVTVPEEPLLRLRLQELEDITFQGKYDLIVDKLVEIVPTFEPESTRRSDVMVS